MLKNREQIEKLRTELEILHLMTDGLCFMLFDANDNDQRPCLNHEYDKINCIIDSLLKS